ncbi:MAG: AsmA family protein [Xanthomonadales bacterium]|nr:AsmA family protein [Xanthomonadales bacterium]
MRRFLLLSLLSLIVLGAALLATGWYLLQDEDFLKARLHALVLQQTGRELAIDGPLRLDLGSESTIEARGIRLQNAAWADGDDMLAVGRLQFAVDLRSLFSDTPVIPSLQLEDCELLFARSADGASNWQLRADSAEAASDRAEPGLPVLLRDGQVRRCRFRFESPQREQPLEVSVDDFAVQLTEDGRVRASGAGRVNEEALSLSGHLGPVSALARGGALQYEVRAAAGDIELQSSGAFQDARSGQGADLEMRFHGPEIARLLHYFGLPDLSAGAFDFRLDLDALGPLTRVEVDGDLGSLQARAEGELDRLSHPTQGRLKGVVTGPDLAALGLALGVSGLAAEAYELQAEAGFEPGLVRVQSLTLASAGDRLALSGALGTGANLAGSDLDFTLSLRQAAQLAAVLGRQLDAPEALALEGRVQTDADGRASLRARAQYVDSVLAVDGTLGALSAPLQPDLRIDFRSPDPRPLGLWFGDVDLPAAPAAARGRVSRPDALLRLEAFELELGDLRARIDGRIAPARPFIGSDLAVTVEGPSAERLGSLFGYGGLPAARFRLAGGVSRPEPGIHLTGVEVDLAGHRAQIDGRLGPGGGLAGSDLRLRLDSPDAAALAGLFGREGVLHEPVTAELALEPAGQGLAFRSSSSGGGVRLNLDGRIADLAQLHTIDARFDLELPSLTLLNLLFPASTLPDLPLAARGQLQSTPEGTRLEGVELSSGTLRATLGGRLLPNQRFDLSTRIEGPDASELQHLVGAELPPEPFSLSAQLAGVPSAFDLSGIEAQLGRSRAGGDLTIALGAPKRITGKLRSPQLDLAYWTGRQQAAEPASPPPAAVFDETPVTRIIDYGLELDLDLGVTELDLGHSQLQDIALGVKLTGQRLELSPLSLRGVAGGVLSGRATLDDSGAKPHLDLALHGQDLRLGLFAVEGQDSATIPASELHLQLAGSGTTQREMASSLNGQLRLFQGPGRVASAGASFLFSDFLTELVKVLNPLAEKSPYMQLDCAVGAADIVDGQVTVSPVVFNTREITIFSRGPRPQHRRADQPFHQGRRAPGAAGHRAGSQGRCGQRRHGGGDGRAVAAGQVHCRPLSEQQGSLRRRPRGDRET